MDPVSYQQPCIRESQHAQVLPTDAVVGGLYIVYVGYYIKMFIDSFRDDQSQVTASVHHTPTLRERVIQRIIYTAQAISASMLFVDWGINKGWFVLQAI